MGLNKIFLKLFIYWNKIDFLNKKIYNDSIFWKKNYMWVKIIIGESIGEVIFILFGLIKIVWWYRYKILFVIF